VSAGIASLIAHAAFWGLMLLGLAFGDVGPRLGAAFLALWAVGLVGLRHLPLGDLLFPSYVAVLDVVLVLVIFKGDVRLN
jgi:hypothetical protein